MDNKKKDLGPGPAMYPAPVYVVGSYNADGTPNIMTASFGGIVAMQPSAIYVSLRKATLTYENITRDGAFTVNIPSERYARETDYVGIVSGRQAKKFDTTGLTAVKSELVNAPYIAEFPVIYECKVIQIVDVGSHRQFIGEIVSIKASEGVLNEKGKPDIHKVKPIVMGNSEFSYMGIGNEVDKAFAYKDEFPKK